MKNLRIIREKEETVLKRTLKSKKEVKKPVESMGSNGSSKKREPSSMILRPKPAQKQVGAKKGKKGRKRVLRTSQAVNKPEPVASTSSSSSGEGLLEVSNTTSSDETGPYLVGDSGGATANINAQSEEEPSGEGLMVIIDENEEEYKKLNNSNQNEGGVMLTGPQVNAVASFMVPDFDKPDVYQVCPGVRLTGIPLGACGLGYIKIEGHTVKPPEVSDSLNMIFWIVEGTLTVKSGGDHYERSIGGETNNYLYGKELTKGVSVVIPKNTVYVFENWTESDAVLAYCAIKDP